LTYPEGRAHRAHSAYGSEEIELALSRCEVLLNVHEVTPGRNAIAVQVEATPGRGGLDERQVTLERISPAFHEELIIAHVRGADSPLGHALEVVRNGVRDVQPSASVPPHPKAKVDVLKGVLIARVKASEALELVRTNGKRSPRDALVVTL